MHSGAGAPGLWLGNSMVSHWNVPRRTCPPACTALVLLEEREVDPWHRPEAGGCPRFLGIEWLPHIRRSVARRTILPEAGPMSNQHEESDTGQYASAVARLCRVGQLKRIRGNRVPGAGWRERGTTPAPCLRPAVCQVQPVQVLGDFGVVQQALPKLNRRPEKQARRGAACLRCTNYAYEDGGRPVA
jgi:hypothetical protein